MRTKTRTSTGVGLILALLISLTGVPSLAQTTTATLSGTVRDGSGAVVNGVTVTLVNTATGRSRSTKTDDEGRYSPRISSRASMNFAPSNQGSRL